MMEGNVVEALKNNVLGTWVLGRAAAEARTEVFVMVSTDKAVNPTSVMGCSKRAAELVVQTLQKRYATLFVAVRFGNVLDSAGSVIPVFRDQIARGGPVTVTHPEMKRYFMTIPEATQLVLQAAALGRGGEIFVLDMGEPVRILDLAEQMISLSGLAVGDDIEIVFSGLRPGEKLFEELSLSEERVDRTRHPKIMIGKLAATPSEVVEGSVAELVRLVVEGDEGALRDWLHRLVPEAVLEPGPNEGRIGRMAAVGSPERLGVEG